MSKYKISIPTPCTEDWNTMSPTDQGKHCAACNKVVIDFSGMNDQEIMDILLKQKGKKVCGNFYNTQINRPVTHIPLKTTYKWPAIAAMVIAGMFQLMPANSQTENRSQPYSYERVNDTKTELKTEPAKDSLITYTIKVLSKKDKANIAGATITIESIGTYTSDKNGLIHFNIGESKIPDVIRIDLFASGFNLEQLSIQKQKITRTKNIELWMTIKENYMLRGDISIEDMR
jgi:hypothetical protein